MSSAKKTTVVVGPPPFRTNDLYFAAFLMASNVRLTGTEREGFRTAFVFDTAGADAEKMKFGVLHAGRHHRGNEVRKCDQDVEGDAPLMSASSRCETCGRGASAVTDTFKEQVHRAVNAVSGVRELCVRRNMYPHIPFVIEDIGTDGQTVAHCLLTIERLCELVTALHGVIADDRGDGIRHHALYVRMPTKTKAKSTRTPSDRVIGALKARMTADVAALDKLSAQQDTILQRLREDLDQMELLFREQAG